MAPPMEKVLKAAQLVHVHVAFDQDLGFYSRKSIEKNTAAQADISIDSLTGLE